MSSQVAKASRAPVSPALLAEALTLSSTAMKATAPARRDHHRPERRDEASGSSGFPPGTLGSGRRSIPCQERFSAQPVPQRVRMDTVLRRHPELAVRHARESRKQIDYREADLCRLL